MNLSDRRRIQIELPEFLIRSLLHRVAETNRGATDDELVELNDVIEWYIAAPITVADIPELEAVIPGFSDALNIWLNTATYEPQ